MIYKNKKDIFNVEYTISLTENGRRTKQRENVNLIANTSTEAKAINKRNVKDLFDKSEKVVLTNVVVRKGIVGPFRARNIFNLRNDRDVKKLANTPKKLK